jgi:hypothetical protein
VRYPVAAEQRTRPLRKVETAASVHRSVDPFTVAKPDFVTATVACGIPRQSLAGDAQMPEMSPGAGHALGANGLHVVTRFLCVGSSVESVSIVSL